MFLGSAKSRASLWGLGLGVALIYNSLKQIWKSNVGEHALSLGIQANPKAVCSKLERYRKILK